MLSGGGGGELMIDNNENGGGEGDDDDEEGKMTRLRSSSSSNRRLVVVDTKKNTSRSSNNNKPSNCASCSVNSVSRTKKNTKPNDNVVSSPPNVNPSICSPPQRHHHQHHHHSHHQQQDKQKHHAKKHAKNENKLLVSPSQTSQTQTPKSPPNPNPNPNPNSNPPVRSTHHHCKCKYKPPILVASTAVKLILDPTNNNTATPPIATAKSPLVVDEIELDEKLKKSRLLEQEFRKQNKNDSDNGSVYDNNLDQEKPATKKKQQPQKDAINIHLKNMFLYCPAADLDESISFSVGSSMSTQSSLSFLNDLNTTSTAENDSCGDSPTNFSFLSNTSSSTSSSSSRRSSASSVSLSSTLSASVAIESLAKDWNKKLMMMNKQKRQQQRQKQEADKELLIGSTKKKVGSGFCRISAIEFDAKTNRIEKKVYRVREKIDNSSTNRKKRKFKSLPRMTKFIEFVDIRRLPKSNAVSYQDDTIETTGDQLTSTNTKPSTSAIEMQNVINKLDLSFTTKFIPKKIPTIKTKLKQSKLKEELITESSSSSSQEESIIDDDYEGKIEEFLENETVTINEEDEDEKKSLSTRILGLNDSNDSVLAHDEDEAIKKLPDSFKLLAVSDENLAPLPPSNTGSNIASKLEEEADISSHDDDQAQFDKAAESSSQVEESSQDQSPIKSNNLSP